MAIEIVSKKISNTELKKLAEEFYENMVKAVVDVQREIMAIGGEMHADAEGVLLGEGSKRADLWGVNLYLDRPEADRIAYTSMINVRPRAGNSGMEVEDKALRDRIQTIINQRVAWE
jgi:hypothetical protein